MRIFWNLGMGLMALVVAAAGGTARAADEDNAQICMFRCAPQLGEQGYDACLSDCFGESDGASSDAGSKVDHSPIFGFWQGKHTACGNVSDDTWSIDASGASAYESTCKLLSSTREGDTFVLQQRCEYFENDVEERPVRIRLVRKKEIEINGTRYRRCNR